MKAMFENSKNLEFCETTVTIKSAMNSANEKEIEALAKEIFER